MMLLSLLSVGRVQELGLLEELLLDHARGHESAEHLRAAGTVVGTRASGTTEGLLADKGGGSFAV